MTRSLAVAALLAGLLPLALPRDGGAQQLEELALACAASDPAVLAACRELALAFQANQGGLGLAVAGGSEFPGSASTMGRRLGTVPRVSVNTRLGFVPVTIPDILGVGGAPAPEESFFVAALRVGGTLGLLNGFSVAPTVGGILSLDLLAELGLTVLPGDEGFDGSVTGYGVGARIGILRESFILPGVSVSLVRRGTGDIGFGDVGGGDPAETAFDLATTSVRGVVGKDLLGLGLLAGVGWDRYSSDMEMTLRGSGQTGSNTMASADGLDTDRWLYFIGGSLTFLIVQVSGELGLADGYDGVPGRPTGGYDPGDSLLFGSLAARFDVLSDVSQVGEEWTLVGDATVSEDDRRFLASAQELSWRGWGHVHPNPMVGCVIVQDGVPVGEGFHREHGGAHAEVHALRAAGERARGATAYVTLEPCNHFGLTPPCTKSLIDAGVRRVVFGASDPGSRSSGGATALDRAGIEVAGPVYSSSVAWSFNPGFFHTTRNASPYVALKLAMTLDAMIARGPGERTYITGPEAERQAHHLRAGFDAIMVGAGTVKADDPLLTVRGALKPDQPPVRIVLDSGARLSTEAALFRDIESAPLYVFTKEQAPEEALEALEAAGASVHPVPASPDGIDLASVLRDCWKLGIRTILCEGGGILASSLLRHGYVQRLYLFVAPWVAGVGGVPAWPGPHSEDGWRGWRAVPLGGAFGRDGLLVFDRES